MARLMCNIIVRRKGARDPRLLINMYEEDQPRLAAKVQEYVEQDAQAVGDKDDTYRLVYWDIALDTGFESPAALFD